jgi:hypothetical protein
MGLDEHVTRTWWQRALARLHDAMDPDAAGRAEEIKALEASVRAHERTSDEQRVRLGALESTIATLARDSALHERAVGKVQHGVAEQRHHLSRVERVAATGKRALEAELYVRARLMRLARTKLPIIVGPWTGEVGFELLYWIPFLQWACDATQFDPERLIVLSRGGVGSWYGHITRNYEELFRYATPEEFRAATAARKKQQRITPFDRLAVRRVMRQRGIRRAHLLHPFLMYALNKGFWRYDSTVKQLEACSRFRRLPPVDAGSADAVLSSLPPDFVAVRFYFSSCFPDTPENRRFATRTVEGLAERTHVVLLNNDIVVDDHRDFAPASSHRVHVLSAHMEPETNLAVQTAIISRARAFIGTYGGYSYLAPLYGVNAAAFYSTNAFKQHHLELAHRAFLRIGQARLVPLDVERATMLSDVLSGLETAPFPS